MLDKHKTFFTVKIKVLESIAHDALVNIRKLWKKKIIEFVNFFESKKKNNLKEKKYSKFTYLFILIY